MKKIIIAVVVVVAVATFLLFSNSVSEPEIEIPIEAPADAQIIYTYDAGFTGLFYQYFISRDTLRILEQEYQEPMDELNEYVYEITEQEFDQLYQLFIDNDFASIEVIEDEVPDKGGESIQLELSETERIIKSATGGDFVNEKHLDRFNAVANAIEEFVWSKQE